MTNSLDAASGKTRSHGNLIIGSALAFVLTFFIGTTLVNYSNTRQLVDNSLQVRNTHEIISQLTDILSSVKDAETGQRGYLLTGEDAYLEPYNRAVIEIERREAILRANLEDKPEYQNDLAYIEDRIDAKLAELDETIRLRRERGFDAALTLVLNDSGKETMDAIRDHIRAMREKEREYREQKIAEADKSFYRALASGLLTGTLGAVLALIIAFLMRRANEANQRQRWVQAGQLGLSRSLFGDQTANMIGENVLSYLSDYFDAKAGVFYIRDGAHFRKVATHGVPADAQIPSQFMAGDGLLGQAATDGKTVLLDNIPDQYLTMGSALGRSSPRHLMISAAAADGQINAVYELGFLHSPPTATLKLLNEMAGTIGTAVRSAQYRENLQNYLEETQRQAEELQAQGEELRVSNEELEEQSRALQESHARMEEQQAEMEQTNAQLEEQTQQLENQRDSLAEAQGALEARSQELEQASRYKSEFLANMSHELRTPLNSSLILAKLLADNNDGNLTDEQVRYAETIQSSGNDLLHLINDILDLSKIEAGHMEVNVEKVRITKLAKDMMRSFEPLAQQKGLAFSINQIEGCPDLIETDGKRMEQILKNLLSNAIKFTEKGSVSLDIRCSGDAISFTVKDSGIGIDAEHQSFIFDAFRQADSTTSRKYGGTGLGLSISRELANLLGGNIVLQSVVGEGSTFTLTLPLAYVEKAPRKDAGDKAPRTEVRLQAPPPVRAKPQAPRTFADDSNNLAPGKLTILVVEDDASFGRILYDLCHELGLQCLLASSAEEALDVALEFMPGAIILDVGLPDHSGLSVLDRVKRDPRLRHIPVHIISAEDYSQTAYAMGAVGYMLKPVKREELVSALRGLESRLDKRLRRVLIVEDDPVQLDSLRKLISMQNVETIGESTAADCLNRLRQETFDCMVLDLTLPDASGYSLLETLNNEEGYAFPPVIVYTGRDLSSAEEQQLRRYSRSIIIKGAKSPERLLDEVTLFLHHVVAEMPADKQRMLQKAKSRDAVLEGRRIMVVEDDIRNIYSLTSVLEPHGTEVVIARNGQEALDMLNESQSNPEKAVDLVLMDVMMPVMDGLAATRQIRQNAALRRLPIIMLTAKAMKDDQETCIRAGANDYMAKPIDVEKLLSLIRVWMPR